MIYIVSGAQWGDEGKAKVIDYFSRDFDIVARYQGGANAGHTVYANNRKFVFHLIPSGILNEHVQVVIGNGLVVDLEEFLKEIRMLSEFVDTKGRIFLSNKAHIVMPYHKILDRAKEEKSGKAIGTTQRGIGPAYIDKADRVGIRIGDLFTGEAVLRDKISRAYEVKKYLLENYYKISPIPTEDEIYTSISAIASKIEPYVTDTELFLQESHKIRKNILFEGAQGALLDMDFGTYPYVTSSNTIATGAFTGSGIGATDIASIIGIVKAYVTRVGEGPFPTELRESTGEALRKAGNEFGATTGRPRRCGWFDVIATRYSLGICGVSEIFLTKLDVLDGMEKLKVCTAYRTQDGKTLDYFPPTLEELARTEPVYREMPGWKEKTFGAKSYSALPDAAKKYIEFLELQLGKKISYISTGFEREDVIVR